MELSEEHTHNHDDDVIEIRIPGWVLWAAGGVMLGLVAVVAWDVYTQRRYLAKKIAGIAAEARTVVPVLDMDKVEEWANKAGTNEQPESPAL